MMIAFLIYGTGSNTNTSSSSRTPTGRKLEHAMSGEDRFAGLIFSFEVTGHPRIVDPRRLLDDAAAIADQIALEGWRGVPHAQLPENAARTDPIGQHAREQRLAIGAAGDEGAQPAVVASELAVPVHLLPVFLHARPAHGIDDRDRAELDHANLVASCDILEVSHSAPLSRKACVSLSE